MKTPSLLMAIALLAASPKPSTDKFDITMPPLSSMDELVVKNSGKTIALVNAQGELSFDKSLRFACSILSPGSERIICAAGVNGVLVSVRIDAKGRK